jgi:hypothetical protein
VVLLAVLVRPEFVLLVVGLALVAFLRRTVAPPQLWRALAPAAVGGVLYLVAHLLYFGDIFPNTYYAKRASDWAHLTIGLDYFARFPLVYPWVIVRWWPRAASAAGDCSIPGRIGAYALQ